MNEAQTRRLDKIGALATILAALGPILNIIYRVTYHQKYEWYGFGVTNAEKSLTHITEHSTFWTICETGNLLFTLPFAILIFLIYEYMQRVEKLWSRLIYWFGILMLLANIMEAVLNLAVFPELARSLDPSDPYTAASYVAILGFGTFAFWLSILSSGATIFTACGIAMFKKAAPLGWCLVGIALALVGFVSLEGTKILRELHSVLAFIWLTWTAILFFWGKFIPNHRSTER